jgi:hypothetical protein
MYEFLGVSKGKTKKGDEVADDEDGDDAVRSSVSQDPATLCTDELFLSTQYMYIALSTYQIVNHVGGEDTYGR